MAYGETDLCTGGTITSSNQSGSYPDDNAFDDDTDTFWYYSVGGQWIKYDFGAGNAYKIGYARIMGYYDGDGVKIKDFVIEGSNNDSDWTEIYSGQQANNENWQTHTVDDTTEYRYIRIDINDATGWWGTNSRTGVREIEMYENIVSTFIPQIIIF